jgi:DNA-binding transcriptional MerR regulator
VSPEVVDRGHLSIGEVLTLLRDEFPDVTISKIRFLESQGLLEPERTASGYRKFYEADVERLRWILRQQREHFLPLKVIRGRLTGEPGGDDEGERGSAPEPAERSPVEPATPTPVRAVRLPSAPAGAGVSGAGVSGAGVSGAGVSGAGVSGAGVATVSSGATGPPARASRPDAEENPRWSGTTGVTLTLQELSAACGLPVARLQELERFGLIEGRTMAGTVYYDEAAMLVANLGASFLRYGVEARHLRLYKNAAEREAGFIEQVVTPLLKQRNPQSRRQAIDTMAELTRLGHELRAALVRQALQDLTGP